jgi:hypothetical protein
LFNTGPSSSSPSIWTNRDVVGDDFRAVLVVGIVNDHASDASKAQMKDAAQIFISNILIC